MVPGNDAVRSQSLMDETVATETLASLSSLQAPLPTLPFDVIPKILCRLPVKLLIQLKSVCKSWKDLISDPKFAKKHLRVSKMYHNNHHVIVSGRGRNLRLLDSTISSIFNDASTTSLVPQLQLICPDAINNSYGRCVSSCDGILLFCFRDRRRLPLLWNPSIGKFKILPPLWNREPIDFDDSDDSDSDDFADSDFDDSAPSIAYSFGYDHFIDNYKVFALTFLTSNISVHVYTLGTDSWRRIDDFPRYRGSIRGPGVFLSGCVNWLVSTSYSRVIVSLDLEKEESYRRLPTPDMKNDLNDLPTLGVLRDCLCIFARNDEFFYVWVMKEYGIEDSWTKLFNVPFVGGPRSFYTKVVYVYEDDQVLLDFKDLKEPLLDDLKLVVYNSRNGTFKIPKIQNMNDMMDPEVYVESLISPCS